MKKDTFLLVLIWLVFCFVIIETYLSQKKVFDVLKMIKMFCQLIDFIVINVKTYIFINTNFIFEEEWFETASSLWNINNPPCPPCLDLPFFSFSARPAIPCQPCPAMLNAIGPNDQGWKQQRTGWALTTIALMGWSGQEAGHGRAWCKGLRRVQNNQVLTTFCPNLIRPVLSMVVKSSLDP